ncbi:hypothetical protein N7456_013543 [Penicillium angulare]|uniref:Uncharacterized protein n=1 Tax=Penicillium angulare TaxID=116970 RepID=A0A9W9JSP5_9EURO|nr:hypothetical protein N7456_013543 [Penicillium angulare]
MIIGLEVFAIGHSYTGDENQEPEFISYIHLPSFTIILQIYLNPKTKAFQAQLESNIMRFTIVLPYIVAIATAAPAPVAPKSNNVARDDCEWSVCLSSLTSTGASCGAIVASVIATAGSDGITLPWLLSMLPEVSPECIVSVVGDAVISNQLGNPADDPGGDIILTSGPIKPKNVPGKLPSFTETKRR